MKNGPLSLLVLGCVAAAVAAGCGGPQDAGSPGPAQTPNAGRDPAAMDPADAVSDPGAAEGPNMPEPMGEDPGRTPSMGETSGTGGSTDRAD